MVKPLRGRDSQEEYQHLERLRAYLNMVRISEELKDSGVSAAQIYEESRRELEERLPYCPGQAGLGPLD